MRHRRLWNVSSFVENVMSRQPTIVYSADSTQQAYLLRSLLADEGIPAQVVNDAIQIAGGDLPVGWRAAAKVVVAEEQADAARRFVAQFDLATQQRRQTVLEADDVGEELRPWADWPHCPQCEQPRSARCPTCLAASTSFPLAEMPDTDDGLPIFHCPTCDDAMRPEWYRRCARCGHDYGEGIEVKPKSSGFMEFSPRSLAVTVVLLLLAGVALAYFAWLFGMRVAIPAP